MVLVGDNEEGKSTLLMALQSALFDRHNVTGKLVQSMMPFGSSVRPEVEIDFELGGKAYSLKKEFGQAPAALLKCDGRTWQNDSVEEALRDLFGFTPPGKGAAKEEHRGLAGLLWVEQGRTFAPLALNTDSRTALQEAIEGEVGLVLGGERGRRLLARVKERVGTYYTRTGREREALKTARARVEGLEGELAELRSNIATYDERVDKLGRLQERLARYDRDNLRGNAKADLEKANVVVKRIKDIEGRIETAEAKVASANAHARSAEDERDKRTSMAKAKEAAAKEANATEAKLRDLEPEWDAATHDLAAVQQRVAERSGHVEDAHTTYETVRRRLRRAEIAAALGSLRLQEAEELSEQIDAEREAVAGIAIDDQGLEQLRDTERRILEQRAALEAAATSLVFAPDGNKSVTANGQPVDMNSPLRVTNRTLVRLEGFGDLDVTPSGEDIGDRRASITTLEGRLRGKLQRLGFETTAAADAVHRAKRARIDEVARLEAKLQGVAPDGLDGLRAAGRKLRQELAGHTAETDGDPLPVEQAQRDEGTAREKQNDARRELVDAERTKDGVQERHDDVKGHWIEASTARQLKAGTLASATADLEEARRQATDEKLEERVSKAQKEVSKRKGERDELIAALASHAPDVVRGEQERAQEAHDRLCESIETDSREARDLAIELRTMGQTGLAEELERKEGELESARRELERVETDAKAWHLLLNTLEEAESQAKATFLAPVNSRLQPYLRILFPEADLQLNEDTLEIAGIRRSGVDEPFASLSIGAREQIAVLTRLALADFLREKGKPVSLILDDPLVNSDDERFRRMEIALRKAAKNVQIIILTCHEARYTTLGAKMIRLSDC